MRTKKIIIGILIGALIGVILECTNLILAFLMPPFFVLLPLAVLIGGCIGAVVKGTRDNHLHGKTQDIAHLPACAAEFIKLVIKKMRYRRKVRQDVLVELAAHFEDELKDCASDEEKKEKAQKLIAEFGDVKLLAVLLRRAKKRCRPLWRTVIVRTFQTIGILILCFTVYTIWFLTGKPAFRVDYLALLNQMSRPQIRDEDNAWPYYEKAVNLYIEPIKGGVVEEFISFRNNTRKLEEVFRFTDLSEEQQTQVLKWIEDNKKYWDNLSAEQQAVIFKCFRYNSVPVFKGTLAPLYTTFESMTKHIIEAIKRNGPVTEPGYNTVVPVVTGFPDAPFTEWVKENKVPPNFFEAISVAVLREWMKRYNNLPNTIQIALSDLEYEYLSPWIKKNEAAWQQFKAGSSKSYCYKEYECDPNNEKKALWEITLPNLRGIRDLARLGIWYCRINLKEGKMHQALEDCVAVARAGSHWQGKGMIVEQLVGTAISALAHNQIINILATTDISTTDLKQIQRQLSEVYSEGYPLMNIEGERLAFLDIVQNVFTDGGLGGGHLIPQKWGWWMDNENDFEMWKDFGLLMPLSTAASIIHARRDETVSKANEFYNRCAENAKITPYEKHIGKVGSTEKILFSLSEYRYFLLRFFMPALDRVSEIVYRGKTSHEATVTILALKRYRQEKNEYPANLNELVTAGYLKELPMDPFSDKPLMYKKTDDDFTLYSLSYNFTDDSGEPGKDREGRVRKWGDNGDAVFWPVQK
jgi:hypothetical protein